MQKTAKRLLFIRLEVVWKIAAVAQNSVLAGNWNQKHHFSKKRKMKVFALILGLTAALKPLKYSSLDSYSDFCSQISTFEAEYDHFSTRNTQKIEIRVITDDRFYQAGGPVLFYTGNEGTKRDFDYRR